MDARALVPPATNYPQFDLRNNQTVLDFDQTTAESAFVEGVLVPSTTLDVHILWSAPTATTGNVEWSVSVERKNTDIDSDSFDTEVTATGAANATSGIQTKTTVSLTSGDLDGAVAGDFVRIRIRRNTSGVTGNLAEDAELAAVELEWS